MLMPTRLLPAVHIITVVRPCLQAPNALAYSEL